MERISIEQMPSVKSENLIHIKRYVKFINSRPERDLKKDGLFFNIHHIVPHSLNGSNSKDNLVKLTHREHYIAHMILWKCGYIEMIRAFNLLTNTKNANIKLTSKQHAKLKEECYCSGDSEETRKKKSMSLMGHFVSEETKEKIRNSNKGRQSKFKGKKHTKESIQNMKNGCPNRDGKNNPFYGKHHLKETKDILAYKNIGKKLSEDTKIKMSISQSIRMQDESVRENLKIKLTGRYVSKETRQKQSVGMKGKQNAKNTKWICNGIDKPILIKKWEKLPAGFHYGRK